MKVVDLGLERTRYAVIDETIESRWRRVTSMQHDAVAVVTPRDRITFAELELRTDALVRELRLRGSHGARPVAVDLEPTAESVPAILATLISGRPLVMIDPQLPEARRAHIMSTSAPSRCSRYSTSLLRRASDSTARWNHRVPTLP